MKKVVRIIKLWALVRCRDCRGDGFVNDGQIRNTCYNCKGVGGETRSFDFTDASSTLLQYGLTSNDIQELFKALIKKQIITPDFKNKSTYHLVSKGYREAILDLAGVEARIEGTYEEPVPKKKKDNGINPELRDRISQMENKMPDSLKKKVSKELEAMDDEEYDDEEDEEE